MTGGPHGRGVTDRPKLLMNRTLRVWTLAVTGAALAAPVAG